MLTKQEIIFELECAIQIAKDNHLNYALELLEKQLKEIKSPVGYSFPNIFPPPRKM